jgi:hypothetical protein
VALAIEAFVVATGARDEEEAIGSALMDEERLHAEPASTTPARKNARFMGTTT